jgi:hypothetical protein
MNAKHMLFLALAPLALACGAPEEEGQPAADDVATTTSALCTDNGVPSISAPIGSAPSAIVSGTSADANYGSPACQGRFVIEATATSGKQLFATADYASVPLSENHCGITRLRTIVYGQRVKLNPFPQPPSLVWEQVGPEKTGYGTWTSFFGGPPYCQGPAVGYALDGRYGKVRVSARADMSFFGGSIPVQVKATVRVADPLPPPR